MRPIPASQRVVDEFRLFADQDVLDTMVETAEAVRDLVPACVGLSLALVRDGLAFTVVATGELASGLDAVQYVDGGPCADVDLVREAGEGAAVTFRSDDPLDEKRWQAFSRASAAAGVASTLTLPVLHGTEVVGSVNLYASTPDAFDGHHEELAAICRAWAPGATANADLQFTTREAAERTPDLVRDRLLDLAVDVLVTLRGMTPAEARSTIRDAAVRAGLTDAQVCELIIEAVQDDDA